MHAATRRLTLAAAALLLTAPAFAQIPAPGGAAPPASPSNAPGISTSHGAGSPADSAMMTGMQKMQQDMSNAPRTGNPDQDFVAMMIPHHQGAVDTAKVGIQYGKRIPRSASSHAISSPLRTGR